MALELHLDASKIGELEDGAQVSSWSDLSGKGRNLAQATESKRPIYKTNILNGLPVVRTADANDYLGITAAAWGAAIAQPTTIFIVTKRIGEAKVAGIFDGGGAPTQNDLYYNASGEYGMYAGTAFETKVASDTKPHLLTAIFSGASSTLRLDKKEVAKGSASTQSLDGFVLGNDSTFANGIAQDIAEVRVYSALSAEERTSIEETLFAKWLSAPADVTLPVVTYVVQAGDELSCSTGTWTGAPTSYAYQWQHSATGVGEWTNIASATKSTYTVAEAYVGEYLRCAVTATNEFGSTEADTAASAEVEAAGVGASILRPSVKVLKSGVWKVTG